MHKDIIKITLFSVQFLLVYSDDCLKHETNGRTIKLVLLLNSFRLIKYCVCIYAELVCMHVCMCMG